MVSAPAKILAVSHDRAICYLISCFLIQQNYQIEKAEEVKNAIAAFEQFNPDLVILDVDLPDADGYNLCQEMQTHTGAL